MRTSILFLAAVALFIPLRPAAADLFSENHTMMQIETDHFVIIYPEQSAPEARYLASIADDMYRDVAAELGTTTWFRRFPVVITPDTDLLNGSFTVYPSMRIRIFQAYLSPGMGFARYNDVLGKLFLHELTHAVSLTIAGPLYSAARVLIGDIVSPAFFAAPPFFIEGVTVARESADGYGRAADTPYAAVIQQDILEGRPMSVMESNGIRGAYPSGAWYIYGGWFSRFVQERYGHEAYAEFWAELGRGQLYQDGVFFPGAFTRAFGENIQVVWDEFIQWMAIDREVIDYSANLEDRYRRLSAIAAGDRQLFINDNSGLYQVSLKDAAGDPVITRLGPSDSLVNSLSLSADGQRLLLSGFRLDSEGQFAAELRLFDLTKGGYSRDFPTELPMGVALAEASWAEDSRGIFAVRLDGYSGDVVYVNDSGEIELVFDGSYGIAPSQPVQLGDQVYFILQIDGDNFLARRSVNHDSQADVRILVSSSPLTTVRNLTVDRVRRELLFTYDDDLTLSKLGRFSPDAGLGLQREILSGGVQFPASFGETAAYVAYFSRGPQLMILPDETSLEMFWSDDLRWEAVDDVFPGRRDASPILVTPDFVAESDYRILPWLLLPQLRYPLVQLDVGSVLNGGNPLISAGLGFISEDPGGSYSLSTSASYRFDRPFAQWSVDFGINTLPTAVTLGASDRLLFFDGVESLDVVRNLSLRASASRNLPLFPVWKQFYGAVGGGGELYYFDNGDGAGVYRWPLQSVLFPLSLRLGYSAVRDNSLDPRGPEGIALEGSSSLQFTNRRPGFAGGFAGLRFDGYLAPASIRMRLFGSSALGPESAVGPGGLTLAGGLPLAVGGLIGHPGYEDAASDRLYGLAELQISPTIPMNLRFLQLIYLSEIEAAFGQRVSYAGGELLHSTFFRPTQRFFANIGILAMIELLLYAELRYLYNRPESPFSFSLFFSQE